MSKPIIRIILDGKAIGTKSLFMNDSLSSIREKIKEKAKKEFIYLDEI